MHLLLFGDTPHDGYKLRENVELKSLCANNVRVDVHESVLLPLRYIYAFSLFQFFRYLTKSANHITSNDPDWDDAFIPLFREEYFDAVSTAKI